jgi:hypothetical protein
MSLYAVALIFPLTGTKGLSQNHEKQTALDHYFASKLYSLHHALRQVVSHGIRQTQVHLSDCQDG